MEEQKRVLRCHKPLIRQYLKPTQVLPDLMDLDVMQDGIVEQILESESNGHREEACDKLIDCLILTKEPGWYKTFIRALKKEGFEILARTIEGYQDVKKQEIFMQLIALFASDICQVDTAHLLPHLQKTGAISEKDCQELRQRYDQKGQFQANLLLLSILPKKREDWFASLLYALKRTENLNLVEIISEKITDTGAETSNDMMKIADKIYQDNIQQDCNDSSYSFEKTAEKVESMEVCDSYLYEGEKTIDSSTFVKKTLHNMTDLPKVSSKPLELDLRLENEPTGIIEKVHLQHLGQVQNMSTNSDMTSNSFNYTQQINSDLSSSSKESTGTGSVEMSYRESGTNYDLQTGNIVPEKNIHHNPGARMSPIGQEADAVSAEGHQINYAASNTSNIQPNNFNKKGEEKIVEKTLLREHTPSDNSQRQEVVEHIKENTDNCSLSLRSFQKELAGPALYGKNSLIVSPTGTGKTRVAVYISKNHLELCDISEDHKVLFIVPTVALVQQQEAVYKKFLSEKWKIIGIFGDIVADKASLKFCLPSYDIFVITPQILVDALVKKEVESLDVFSLIIFDECHHTMKSHPYNAIMCYYFQEKETKSNVNLPQIVGLTASVGVGKATTVDSACDHILKLCANLDADIHTVQKEVKELKKFTNVPVEESHEVRGRQNDPFKDIINEIMGLIETKIEKTTETVESDEIVNLRSLLKPPRERGCERYTQWISGLRRPIAIIYEQKVRRVFVACTNHLKTYNEALLLNADCRSKDALNHIKNKFGEFKEAVPFRDETDKWLDEIFYEKESNLQEISHHRDYVNPKLMKIKELLNNQYRETPDLRAIIFVKTRDMTVALENWINEDPDLKVLKPSQLVGAGVSSDKGGMTQQKQNDVVKYFKGGKHKVILATTIAEEGLDIKKCNLVIRYEHVTNETARIQSKGRSRDEDSKYMLVASKDSSSLTKEEINKEREELMYQAIAVLLAKAPDEIQKRKQHFQQKEQMKRKNKEIQQLFQSSLHHEMSEEDYELRCIKCDMFACFSFDICKILETNHVVISQDFIKAAVIEKHPRPGNMGDLKKVGKLFCSKCHYDWGVQAIYQELKYPCIKISSFVLVDSQDKRDTCKKWKFSPFKVRELRSEDQMAIAELQCFQ